MNRRTLIVGGSNTMGKSGSDPKKSFEHEFILRSFWSIHIGKKSFFLLAEQSIDI